VGEVSYRPLIEDMTWSYSRLSSFETCPYAWYIRYILEEEEEPMFYASYGSFIHRLIERYYSGELTKEEMPTAFLLGFSSEVQGERPPQSTVVKYINAGREYMENFQPFQFEKRDVEEEIHFDVNGAKFVAFVDYIGERDGKLAIIDNKSRDLKPRSHRKTPTVKDQELDAMLRQLYLYAHGVKQKYGELPSLLCFNCFKNQQFIEEPFNQEAYEETLDWAGKTIETIASEEDFKPNIDYFQCRYLCGYHNDCCFAGGG